MSGAFEFAGVDSVGPEVAEDVKPVVCRGCLAAERSLRPLKRTLATLYEQLTQTPSSKRYSCHLCSCHIGDLCQVSESEVLPKFVCSYCRALLLKFGRFREKCCSAQNTFIDLHNGKYPVSLDHIKNVIDSDSYTNLQISEITFINLEPDLNYAKDCNFSERDDVAQVSDVGNTVNIDRCDNDPCNTDDSSDSDITLANLNIYTDKNKRPVKESVKSRRLKIKTEKKQRHKSLKRNTRRCQKKDLSKLKPFEYNVKEIKASVETLKAEAKVDNNRKANHEKTEDDDAKDIVINNSTEQNDVKLFINATEDQDIGSDSDKSTNNQNNIDVPDAPVETSKHPHKQEIIKEKIITKPTLQKKVSIRNKLTKKTVTKREIKNLKETKESHESLKAKKKNERTQSRKLQHETKCNVRIVVLSKEEQIKQIQERKNTSNYTRALHKCQFCYRGFNTEYSYKNHMTKHDLSEGEFVCDVCSMRYSSKLKLKKHVQAHHVYDFICNQCGFVSKSSADAGKHYRWHKGVKYDCKICGKTFDKPNSVMGHMHLSHGGTSACPVCGQRFLGDKGLRAHMLLAHREAVGAVCSACSIQFHSHAALQCHTELGCRIHEGHRSCAACGEGFPTEELLQQHTLDQHKKGYVCETCGALFNDDGKYQSKAIFEDHCRTHSGERPFECHLCLKRFATKQACRVHIARHTAKKGVPVSHCRACDKHFTQHSNYKRHVRVVHQNLRPFTCDLCGAAYKDKYPLQIHVNTKHLGLPWPKRTRKRRAYGDDNDTH